MMAGSTEVPAVAGEGQKVLVVAASAFHAGKAVAQVAAVQVPVNDIPEIGTEESVRLLEPFSRSRAKVHAQPLRE